MVPTFNGREIQVKKGILFVLSLLVMAGMAVPLMAASADQTVAAGSVYTPHVTQTQGEGGWYYLTAFENSSRLEYMPVFDTDR